MAKKKTVRSKVSKKKKATIKKTKPTTQRSTTRGSKAASSKKKATKASTKKVARTKAKVVSRKKVARQTLSQEEVAELLSNPDREPPTEAQLRRAKSGLTRKDTASYRDILMQKRRELLGDVESLQSDARNNNGESISYEHMADTGSDSYEQEFTLGLVASERKLLSEIDEALMRLDNGTYGVCLETAQPIGKARLDAKPWARYCIEVVRERERRGLS